jgi:hypothetical protein
MQLTTVLTTAFLSVLSLASASPIDARQATTTPPSLYYLRTKVVNGNHKDTGSNKTGLYLYSYHTGAGLGDAALSSNKSIAFQGYLNGSMQLMTYDDNSIGPWPLAIAYGPYQGKPSLAAVGLQLLMTTLEFNAVTISIAGLNTYDTGFFFNSSGLQYNQSTGGWLGMSLTR